MVFWDTFFEVLNYMSGIIFTIMWIPQIYKLKKTGSGEDISMLMLAGYITALSFLIAFSAYNLIYSLLIPGALDIALVFLVVGMKIYYDRKNIPVV